MCFGAFRMPGMAIMSWKQLVVSSCFVFAQGWKHVYIWLCFVVIVTTLLLLLLSSFFADFLEARTTLSITCWALGRNTSAWASWIIIGMFVPGKIPSCPLRCLPKSWTTCSCWVFHWHQFFECPKIIWNSCYWLVEKPKTYNHSLQHLIWRTFSKTWHVCLIPIGIMFSHDYLCVLLFPVSSWALIRAVESASISVSPIDLDVTG